MLIYVSCGSSITSQCKGQLESNGGGGKMKEAMYDRNQN